MHVRSKGTVLACWNSVIPYICDEIPQKQKEALSYGVKAPLVYTGVLVSNWQSFVDAGISRVTAPGGYHPSIGLQPMLEMGSYRTARSPDQPIVVRMSCYFTAPGLSRREQHRAGRAELLGTTFDTFEYHIRDQLARILGPTGFDDERDILGITANRWPHGYTYSYNPLFDPEEWAFTTTAKRPAVIGRQPIGRITIANSDAAASPHTDAAIGEAYRAVSELVDS
jgi:spermidine dehydrogenase